MPGAGQVLEIFLYDQYDTLLNGVVLGLVAVVQPFVEAIQQSAVYAIRRCFLHHFNELFPVFLQAKNDAVVDVFQQIC